MTSSAGHSSASVQPPDVRAPSISSNWRTWASPTWSQHLVEHFFLRRPEREGPVVTLLVTPEELARSAGVPLDQAGDVRDAFVASVLAAINKKHDLIDDASDYFWWPKPPPPSEPLRFVAHLIFTCLAAAESNEEIANESRFIARLRELAQDQLPEGSLKDLPQLWRNLADWLSAGANRQRFRPLKLPDPGGLTRIGYTVKLTFPDRRDQAALSRLLDERGLSGAGVPPFGTVLALVASNLGEFRKPFLDQYRDFRRARDAEPRATTLTEHPFWSAVRDAALRGRGASEDAELDARAQLLCLQQDDLLALYLVADGPINEGGNLESTELEAPFGVWSHAILPSGSGAPSAERFDATARALLSGSLRVPRLSGLVDQGLLAFSEASHGLLELATGENFELAETALVRSDLVPDLVAVLHASSARQRASAYPGWVQFLRLKLKRLPSDVLEKTKLDRCWQLHETLASTSVQLVAGVRCDDGWLGYREILPRVSAPGGHSVVIESEDGTILAALESAGDETWRLPARDLVGELALVVETTHGDKLHPRFHFYGKPAAARYRRPRDGSAWRAEGLNDSSPLGVDPALSDRDTQADAESLCERVTYLGPVVGEFLTGPERAAWRFVQFGGNTFGAPVHAELCVPPTAEVNDPHLRRRWHKMLTKARAAVPAFDGARRAIGKRFSHLPQVELPSTPSTATPREVTPPPRAADPRVERLLSILATRACSRAGLPWGEWKDLVSRIFAFSPSQSRAVMRAWEEAGVLDVASLARWRSLAVFARDPMLVAVRSGPVVRATLMGLALESMRTEVGQAASRLGVPIEERGSFSPHVPRTLALRAASDVVITEIARSVGIGVKWLDLSCLGGRAAMPRGLQQEPPVGYVASAEWPHWSLTSGAAPSGASVVRWTRPGQPDYWTVKTAKLTVWTYHPNTARLWASAALAEDAIIDAGEHDLRARHAYLPIPLARVVAVLGAALPGPDPTLDWAYRYVCVSDTFASLVKNAVRAAFDVSNPPSEG